MIKRSGYVFLISLFVLAVMFCGCTSQSSSNTTPDTGATQTATVTQTITSSSDNSLLIYCGAGMKKPMQEIGDAFEKETGIQLNFNYAGCGNLLAQMELTKTGDVFMPGASKEFKAANEKGFIENSTILTYHIPAIATPKGNPKNIKSLDDLTNPGVNISMGDPKSMALGTVAENIFNKSGILDKVMKNVVVERATVNEIVTDVTLGNVDAGIIWADLYNPDKMDLIEIPVDQNVIGVIPIGTLTFSENPKEAREFIEYVASDKGGMPVLKKYGFVPYPNSTYEQ
ncbi:molybdate transport system substrate-binding protein [Methanomicrobium sp. W14]|uniref:molybdate ABC transporter substrate-binding protein n=1 Tax=Methanomicrobium sp. W14 TaxID=2817839 RepID=UPI001AE8269E|nr:molybdate ABC transporter substrate-binding protein [Methanomicrobium sp. W14]MBP2134549.1 molybdate transport system substrate-binding protein [Methanomicrobium sp. W14]